MGLDSWFETEKEDEIKYWRNHHNLHAWMKDLARSKGMGELRPGRFQLLIDDLKSLREHIDSKLAEDWQRNASRRHDRIDDLDVISHAMMLMRGGETIWYCSCW